MEVGEKNNCVNQEKHYMENRLIASSKLILLDVDDYEGGSAVFQRFRIKDSYEPRSKANHGRYRILIESPIIYSSEDLIRVEEKTRNLAILISSLLKCVIGQALNTTENTIDTFTKQVFFSGQMPLGWNSNYKEVKACLDGDSRLSVDLQGVIEHYCIIEKSPFNELIKALKAYPKLPIQMKDLLVIMNEVDWVSNTSRYMLIGKGLEIIDSFHPLEKKNDDRIHRLFPEIEYLFKGVTLKKLFELANYRKESRHYVGNKKTMTPHQSMTQKELKLYYYCSNLLFVNVLRKALGLQVKAFTMEGKKKGRIN